MSGQRATQEQVDSAYRRAGELLLRGVPAEGVKHILKRRGWSDASAAAIIADVEATLGLRDAPGRRQARHAWIAFVVTAGLAAAGAASLIVSSLLDDARQVPGTKMTDAALLVL